MRIQSKRTSGRILQCDWAVIRRRGVDHRYGCARLVEYDLLLADTRRRRTSRLEVEAIAPALLERMGTKNVRAVIGTNHKGRLSAAGGARSTALTVILGGYGPIQVIK